MKKWSKYLIISIIVMIICMILCGIFNTSNDTKVLWEVFRVLLVVAIISVIITMVGCIVVAIKNKEKMPLWVTIIIALFIAILVMYCLGSMSKKDFDDEATQRQQEIQDYLKNPEKYNYDF